MKIESAKLHQISLIAGKDAVPTTTKIDGNVTVNNIGRDAIPAKIEVTGHLTTAPAVVDVHTKQALADMTVSWTVCVPDPDGHMDIRQVSDAHGRALPSLLRSLADTVEAELSAPDETNLPSTSGDPE